MGPHESAGVDARLPLAPLRRSGSRATPPGSLRKTISTQATPTHRGAPSHYAHARASGCLTDSACQPLATPRCRGPTFATLAAVQNLLPMALAVVTLAGCAGETQSMPSSLQPVAAVQRSAPDDPLGLGPVSPAEPTHTDRRPSISLGYAGDGVLGGGVARDAPIGATAGARGYTGAPPYFSRQMDTYVPPRGRGGGPYPYSWRGRECASCRR